MNILLLDVPLTSGGSITGVAIGLVFFLIFAAVAFVAFKLLKRTVKMAFRMVIVAIILLIALVGGVSLMMFGSSTSNHTTRPTPPRTR